MSRKLIGILLVASLLVVVAGPAPAMAGRSRHFKIYGPDDFFEDDNEDFKTAMVVLGVGAIVTLIATAGKKRKTAVATAPPGEASGSRSAKRNHVQFLQLRPSYGQRLESRPLSRQEYSAKCSDCGIQEALRAANLELLRALSTVPGPVHQYRGALPGPPTALGCAERALEPSGSRAWRLP